MKPFVTSLLLLLSFFSPIAGSAQLKPTEKALEKVMTFETTMPIGEEGSFYIASTKNFWIDWGNGVWRAYNSHAAAFHAGGIVKGSTIRIAGEQVWDVTLTMPIVDLDLTRNDELVNIIDHLSEALQCKTIDFSGNPNLQHVALSRSIYNNASWRGTFERLDFSHNHQLQTVYLDNHKISSLIFSKQAMNLSRGGYVKFPGNRIKGENMRALIESLPDLTNVDYIPNIVLLTAPKTKAADGNEIIEENEISIEDYKTLQNKGYQIFYHNLELMEEPNSISKIHSSKTSDSIYDIFGRRSSGQPFGIQIKSGQKMLTY